MQADLDERYYVELAAAFVRGHIGSALDVPSAVTMRLGQRHGLRLHKFKRTDLARVRKVLGILRGLAPESVLDIGSGRGAFLWPLLDAFPETSVLSVELSARRATDIRALRVGGVRRLAAARMDAASLGLMDRSFDVVTLLEVLEHLPLPAPAVGESVRVARRCVIASVPLHRDDNPGHIHLFDPATLEGLFLEAGARRVSVDYVLNHAIVVATR
jgi:SAM-dependent methyltransferase